MSWRLQRISLCRVFQYPASWQKNLKPDLRPSYQPKLNLAANPALRAGANPGNPMLQVATSKGGQPPLPGPPSGPPGMMGGPRPAGMMAPGPMGGEFAKGGGAPAPKP